MASGAITLKRFCVIGDRKEVIADLVLTGSYVVGGHPVTGALFNLELELFDLQVDPAVGSLGTLMARYDEASGKVLLYGNSDGTAAVNEANPELTAVALPGGPLTIRCHAQGKGTIGI
jgi:hypothetical protein